MLQYAMLCRSIVFASTFTLASALPTMAQAVPQNSHCSIQNSDYIELPDGRCIDLDHLSWLGLSQQNLEAATQSFLDAVELNNYESITYTDSIGVGNVYTSSSITIQDNPTAAQEAANLQYMADKADDLAEAADTHLSIADEAFRSQTTILLEVSGTMSGE